MITVTDLSLSFAGTKLFDHVNLKFLPGNCYGIIGANGAGKSTFLKILSGELESTTGEVSIAKNVRMSVLKQDHYAYDAFNVLDTVIQGNPRLYQIIQEKEALYAKEDFSEADGILVSELEGEFSELDGWDAETEAAKLLQGLGLDVDILYASMESLSGKEKVKVLLAQALFGKPEIILLDEPTNSLDIRSITWLEDFLLDYEGTVIVVSHDRHFLNTVCTHTVDIDYTSIRLYTGNYDFWYESSMLIQRIMRDQNRKREDKIKELETFVARFSANKSKSKQATSRKKLLDKLAIDELPASSRRYPYVGFQMDREPGKEILSVEDLSQAVDGVKVFDKLSFRLNKGDKVAFVGEHDIANTALFRILVEEAKAQEGDFRWGVSTSFSYFPADNTEYFEGSDLNILQWLGQYAEDQMESYLRGFLGRMLFSGDDVFKPVRVLSGGERVRCMLARMMMRGSNVLILDQPTNHLDLESITALNNGLADFKGIVLFASHDHQFIQTIANRIIELKPDGVADRKTTYDEYLTLAD
ncbi:MAG: ATP-binding cassette protein [Firmicutes bacterium]|nr:ATP-binding cassette protein [Bacillota bacterium]